jgi:uncharacterized protein YecE (DUF72 family)
MSVGSIMGLPGERKFVNERAGVNDATCRIGVAGWGLSRTVANRFPAAGTHLQRYASVMPAVEINSCFYRHHRPATYAKWAASVPDEFRFSVKLPKAITHEAGLAAWEPVLGRFLDETASLGEKLGCVLVQLPPRLAFDAATADAFFQALRARYPGPLALEPRHATWGADAPERLLRELGIARVAADPVRFPGADQPSGSDRLVYYRLHGSPRIYHSEYSRADLERIARGLEDALGRGADAWCIFDNTASGAAVGNAIALLARMRRGAGNQAGT